MKKKTSILLKSILLLGVPVIFLSSCGTNEIDGELHTISFYDESTLVEKIETKGSLGNDYLTRVGDRIYEGIRIKPDGTQVKIRFNDKTYKKTELGPVE